MVILAMLKADENTHLILHKRCRYRRVKEHECKFKRHNADGNFDGLLDLD